jgi:hypothetical protein
MDELQEEALLIERQIGWLQDATPEDWHRVALDFNWDNPIDPLYWIVQQPQCDRATALTIFWLAQPTCYSTQTEADDWDAERVSERKLVQFIADRIHGKGFERAKIAFDATPLVLQDYDELAAEGKKTPDARLKAHADMKRSIRGLEIRLDRAFYERYPEEFHGSVRIELPESDIVTPHMKTARFEVATAILNLMVVGFMVTYLAGFGAPKSSNLKQWIAAVAALCICLYSSRASLQIFRGLVRAEQVPMPLHWIRTYVVGSLLSGALLGLVYQSFFVGYVSAFIKSFGTFAAILAGLFLALPVLWFAAFGLARVLVYRKTFR